MNTLLFSVEQIESERFLSDVIFWSKSDFSIKSELKNWVSGNFFFSKIWLFEKFFIIKSAGTKNSQFKTWPFGNFSFQIFIVQENVCFRIWFLLFQKFHFKIWFSMKKFATKSCRLKSAGKFRNLFLSAEQIDLKRYFLNVIFWSKSDSSIKIELKTWFFDNKFFPKCDYPNCLVFEICRN